MKLASIKPKDIALVKNDSLIPMGETLARESALPKGCSMLDVIVNYARVNDLLESYAARITATKLDPKMLKAPIGPWITTKEEIADPHQLSMKLWINGELKQSARTDSMVNDIPTLVSYLSQVTTLFPGDLISTGNPDAPEFQEKLKPGDILRSEIEGIGAMNLGVAKQ